jgi:opacity protein-like surface antigen
MKHVLIAAAGAVCLLAGAANAQEHQAGSANPAVKDGTPHHVAKPAEGANSFTADQAHGRLEKAGYTKISKLTKKDGLWSGTAVKDGKKSAVMLDFKGNVTTR